MEESKPAETDREAWAGDRQTETPAQQNLAEVPSGAARVNAPPGLLAWDG